MESDSRLRSGGRRPAVGMSKFRQEGVRKGCGGERHRREAGKKCSNGAMIIRGDAREELSDGE